MTREHSREAGAPSLVVSTHGRHVIVETPEGKRVQCHTRGKRSDLVVGDHVRWQISGDQGVITAREDRRNVLHRQDEWKTKTFAANLDQVLLIVAVEPPFGDAQLTRSLVAVADAGLPVHIVCNKVDLPQAQATLDRLRAYESAEVDILPLALKPRAAGPSTGLRTGRTADEARERLMPLLRDKVTLVIGPSGVGKSTLINLVVPNAQAQVGEISTALNAGRHTTTATRWYWLEHGVSGGEPVPADGVTTACGAVINTRGALIDTPGFQQFGVSHIAPERLASLMPDIQAHAVNCRFYNCTHRQEPGCGVLAAMKRGDLSARRHALFVELLDDLTAGSPGG